jgi:hypothetical protein
LISRHAATTRLPTKLPGTLLLGVALALVAAPSRAEDTFGERTAATPSLARVEQEQSSEDGVYGRLAGDLTLAVAAGGEADFSSDAARLAFMASGRYFSTVGVYGALREGVSDDDDVERILSTGVLVEPLFVTRAVYNMQQGPAFWDLALDSIGLSFGAFWAQPTGGDLGDERGAELGLGAGLPLLGTAAGPWLRTNGFLRWDEASSGSTSLWVTLEWRALLNTGLTGGHNIGD